MTVDKKKAEEALWGICMGLTEAITNCEDKDLQNCLKAIDDQVVILSEAINIEPAHNGIKLFLGKSE